MAAGKLWLHPAISVRSNGLAVISSDLTLELLPFSKRFSHKSNLYLNDKQGESAVTDSLVKFKQAGGACVMENSTLGWNRRTQFLRRLSKTTGVHVVVGTGYYLQNSVSEEIVSQATVEHMAKFCTGEVQDGCHDDPSIKCGFIGEVGISNQMTGDSFD